MEFFRDIWTWLGTEQSNSVPIWYLITALLFGFSLYFFKITHRITKLIGSLIHEAGHAIVALVLGMRVSRIKLDSHGNGVTEFYSFSRIRNFPVALAGYLAPPSLAVALAYAVMSGYLNLALAILIFTFLILSIFVRSITALLTNIILGFIIYFAFESSPWISEGIVFLLIGILLSGGIFAVLSAYKVRKSGNRETKTDPQVLSSMTLILPSIIWEFAFAIYAICATIYIIRLLISPI
jgi:F0F1-type ATP synthase assembly protein I